MRTLLLFSGMLIGHVTFSQSPMTIPLRTHFSAQEYNGGIQNWAFDQDSSGILYVANNYDLLSFDGLRWQLHQVPKSTKLRTVKCIGDRIYVGGQGQIGYFEETDGGLVFNSLLERLPEEQQHISETWNIIEHQGGIYFNTLNKLLLLKEGNFSSIDLPYPIQRIYTGNENLYIQFEHKGIFNIDKSEFIQIPDTDFISESFIQCLSTQTTDYFVSISGNLFSLDSSGFKPFSNVLNGYIVNTALKLRNGDYAFGTQNNGLLILDSEWSLKHQFTKNQGISNRTVNALHEDNFNNLWVGLQNGIDYLELSSPFSLINEQVGLEGTGYSGIKHNGQLFLGTSNGLYVESISGFQQFPESQGQVYNLTHSGTDLILNHHKGAFVIEDDHLTQISDVGSWKFVDAPNQFSIHGSYEGLTFFNKSQNGWWPSYKIEGLNESSRIFEFENDSVLWMTHGYYGAYQIELSSDLLKTKSIRRYGSDDGFPSNTLINVYKISGELIFTGEDGLYDFNVENQKFQKNVFLQDLMGDGHVSKIAPTESGDIYFIHERKIGLLLNESFGSYKKQTDVFKRVNQILSDDLENISIIDSKNVLIGAKEGFIHYNPTKTFSFNDKFNVLIRNIEIRSEDSTISVTSQNFDKLSIEKDQSIKFTYASPYFDGFADLDYSYRISNIFDKWSDWNASGEKEFDVLPAGSYIFEVKAKNIYGVESEVTKVEFKVLDPWYSTSFAISIYVLLGLILTAMTPLIQRKKHKTEKAELHESKKIAIKEKEMVISEIEQKSTEKLNALKNEKLKTEIGHKNSQLSSVTTHLLQKNELIQEIKSKIEQTIPDSGSRSELKKIIKSIDRNLLDDDSWDQFSQHFDQVHGDFLKKIGERHLTPQETKLAAYLRMNMTSKEIAGLMNISVRGVELARYRLRKKLGLQREQNLVEYLLSI